MRNIALLKQGIKATNAFYERPVRIGYNRELKQEIDFCMNCTEKRCKGECKAFKAFRAELYNKHRKS